MSDSLRVLTFNVLALAYADGRRRSDVIRRAMAELRPDVVALQEVTRSGTVDQATELLGPDVAVVDHPGRTPDGVGACLGSRWPVVRTSTRDLQVAPAAEGLPWAATVAVEIAAPAPLGPLLVVHHKPSWQLDREHEREQQAVAGARFVEELVADRPDLPVIVLGDFDAAPDAASMRFWTGTQSLGGTSVRYEDAWVARRHDRDERPPDEGEDGHTFTPRNPLVRVGDMPLERGRRIDYVLVRSGPHGPLLEVVDCRVVFDRPVDGVWPSDHFGVLADLRRPPHQPGTWNAGA
jgi:endonuclease/exonuclease/phosphatase family metal-dependent hydrolase